MMRGEVGCVNASGQSILFIPKATTFAQGRNIHRVGEKVVVLLRVARHTSINIVRKVTPALNALLAELNTKLRNLTCLGQGLGYIKICPGHSQDKKKEYSKDNAAYDLSHSAKY
jgi:hypothetical protein